ERMRGVHGKRSEAPLPKMAAPILPEINAPRVPAMDFSEAGPERILGARHQDKVDMVRHHAVCPDLDARLLRPFSKELTVDAEIVGGEEDWKAAIPALSDVMRDTRSDDSSDPGHYAYTDEPRPSFI